MGPHTGPFTLTHTPAGCPPTHTPPSLLTGTYPPPSPPPHVPSTILAQAHSQSHIESHAPPCRQPWVSLCRYDCPQLRREEPGSEVLPEPGGAWALSATELGCVCVCVCMWYLYDCRLDPEVSLGSPGTKPHLR